MTEPLIATCSWCPGLNVACVSAAHMEKVETAHAERWHAELTPTSDAVCEQMVAKHPDEHEVVVAAIEACARLNHGRVDPNEVRGLIPPGITPQVIGPTYRVLKNRGRLKVIDENVNNDTRSRNVGKKQPVYELVPEVGRQTA